MHVRSLGCSLGGPRWLLALVLFVPQGFWAGAEAGATACWALPLPVSWVHVRDGLGKVGVSALHRIVSSLM